MVLFISLKVSLDSKTEFSIDITTGLLEPLLHFLLLIKHLSVALLLIVFDLFKHHVLLSACLGQASQVHLHALSFLDLPKLSRVHASLLAQFLIVLIHFLFSSYVLHLLVREAMLEDLVNLSFLLSLIHYFLQRLR